MQVIANIHTGNRTFQYLFQPFIDSMDDAMRERWLIFRCLFEYFGTLRFPLRAFLVSIFLFLVVVSFWKRGLI